MHRQRRLVLFVSGILAIAAALRAQEIDDEVKGAIERLHIPGLSVAIVKDGSLIKATGYGLANIEHDIPVRPESVFKIGSVSKQFLAAGIMLLVQDGKIALDDQLAKHLAGTPAAWQAITIRHLLTHTSGLVREGPGFDPYKVQPDIDVIQTAYNQPLRFQPGEKWEYCNVGYFILAELIHRISGKPWSEFLTDRVFAPLGMTSTRVTSLSDIVYRRASGYAWDSGRFQNLRDWPAVRPSGAFLSTVLDLAKWEAALLTDRILKESSKREMWKRVELNDGRAYPYGFGWQLDDFPLGAAEGKGIPMIRHGGTLPGFRAGYFRWPNQGLAVIVLTNRDGATLEGMAANLAIRYAPELKEALAQKP